MKHFFAPLVGLMLAAGNGALAQYGTVFLNNWDSGKGIFDICGQPAPAGSFVEVLGGPAFSPLDSLRPVATALGASRYTFTTGDINAAGPHTGSFFDYGFGFVPGVAPGATALLTLRYWRGAASYYEASIRGSVSWTQPTGTNPSLPYLPQPAVLVMPGTIFLDQGYAWISLQPRSQTANAGENATFTADAVAYATLQWRKNGVALSGATSATLMLTNVTRADSGTYSLVATGLCSSVESRNATLRVLVPQRFGSPLLLGDGRLRLSFRDQDDSVASLNYATNFEVEASTNLTNWQKVTGSVSSTNGFLVFEENSPLNSAARFYRIVER